MISSAKSTLYKNLCIALGLAVLVLGYYQFFGNTEPQEDSPKKINGYISSTGSSQTGAIEPKNTTPTFPPVSIPNDTVSSGTSATMTGADQSSLTGSSVVTSS